MQQGHQGLPPGVAVNGQPVVALELFDRFISRGIELPGRFAGKIAALLQGLLEVANPLSLHAGFKVRPCVGVRYTGQVERAIPHSSKSGKRHGYQFARPVIHQHPVGQSACQDP